MAKQTAPALKYTPVVESWEDVNLLLKHIKEQKTECDRIDSEAREKMEPLAQQIGQLRIEADAKMQPLRDEIKESEEVIEAFTRLHKDELDGKSKKLRFGAVRLREAIRWLWPEGAELKDLIAILARTTRMAKYILQNPQLDKVAFKRDPDAHKYVNRETNEEFSYEVY